VAEILIRRCPNSDTTRLLPKGVVNILDAAVIDFGGGTSHTVGCLFRCLSRTRCGVPIGLQLGIGPGGGIVRPGLDPPPLIFGNAMDTVTGQPFGFRVCGEKGMFRIRIFNPNQSALAGSHPKLPGTGQMNSLHITPEYGRGSLDRLKAAFSKTEQTPPIS
jgi:hypothetical protein